MILNQAEPSRPSSGAAGATAGPVSILANAMLETCTWSPRAPSKPIVDFTSASICFSSAGERGL